MPHFRTNFPDTQAVDFTPTNFCPKKVRYPDTLAASVIPSGSRKRLIRQPLPVVPKLLIIGSTRERATDRSFCNHRFDYPSRKSRGR
jgi:hypothetical protein